MGHFTCTKLILIHSTHKTSCLGGPLQISTFLCIWHGYFHKTSVLQQKERSNQKIQEKKLCLKLKNTFKNMWAERFCSLWLSHRALVGAPNNPLFCLLVFNGWNILKLRLEWVVKCFPKWHWLYPLEWPMVTDHSLKAVCNGQFERWKYPTTAGPAGPPR